MKQKINRRSFLAATSAGLAVPMAFSHTAGSNPEKKGAVQHAVNEKEPIMSQDPLAARITLVQMTAGANIAPPIDRMPNFFEQAADLGSDLVVFPEYILGHHITPEDDVAQRFFELARKHHINAIAGCVERHGEDSWCTSAWVVNREGKLVGRYLKSHPASGPAPHWWPPVPGQDSEAQGVLGSQFKVFYLDFAPIGILQCYDGYFPEAFACTSYMGAEIILWMNGRAGMIEDPYCITAANCYGCVVGGVITEGHNTGFAGPGCVAPMGDYSEPPEEMRLYPRIRERGDSCVSAVINLSELRWKRKHLRTMHQRRPDMYGLLTQDVKMWQNYPE
ncbi:MAG: carbon-nitrogen hydrolase family protein, partial [Candidatus Hydrogenedentes bacterium]|nr:carbon-nitrogen hydrolase family protein [Candidatus Hydrogenedentota bacterium]